MPSKLPFSTKSPPPPIPSPICSPFYYKILIPLLILFWGKSYFFSQKRFFQKVKKSGWTKTLIRDFTTTPLPIPKIFFVVYLLKPSSECLVSYDPHFPGNDGTNEPPQEIGENLVKGKSWGQPTKARHNPSRLRPKKTREVALEREK